MEEEIWRAIPNYEDLYEVSNLGRVRSLKRGHKAGGYHWKYIESEVM